MLLAIDSGALGVPLALASAASDIWKYLESII
jgi:hypothetical protein